MNAFIPACGFILGGAIGYVFGAIQNAALLKNKGRQEKGALNSGWRVMPGSTGRVAMLLMVLALVQLLCPMFFDESSTQWLVSAGVLVGYGWTLLHKLRHYSTYRA